MAIELLNIDLISINCVNPSLSVAAIRHCQKHFKFGRSTLVSHIEPEDHEGIEFVSAGQKLDWYQYNNEILQLSKYSDNEFVLVIQDDGYIINPSLWDEEFLKYDYIGAPWPIEDSWISMQTPSQQPFMRMNFPQNRVGNGGFSLRSKKFLEFSSQFQSAEQLGEDTFLCTRKYKDAISAGIRFAPFELAVKFAYENPCFEYDGHHWNERIQFDSSNHFGWHGHQFANKDLLLEAKFT